MGSNYVVLSKEIFSDYILNWFDNNYSNRIKQTSVTNRGEGTVRVKLYLTHTRELKKHLNIAGDNTFGLRFHNNGMKAYSQGSDLFETFGPQTNLNNLALPPVWNRMTGIKQWQVKY